MDRNAAIRAHTEPLPGSGPYDLRRPIRVRDRYDTWPLLRFLGESCRSRSVAEWRDTIAAERLLENDRPVDPEGIVRAGQIFVHVVPNTIEPPVNVDIRVLHEDDALLVVAKPAPLPVHPCGRFNKNSLVAILEGACPELRLRVVHRLDSHTTGCMVFAKTREAAHDLCRQFKAGSPKKIYVARVLPAPKLTVFSCDASISREPGPVGSRCVDARGLAAHTQFSARERFEDGSALVEAVPVTGRTHQIRVHLAHLGSPIVGDVLYGNQDADAPTTLCLHALSLTIKHPGSGDEVTYSAGVPPWA